MGEKERIDVRLLREGLAASREKAKELIQRGGVLVNGRPARKAGEAVGPEDAISLAILPGETESVYVSRGGYKLEKALETFGVDPTGCWCLDAGASTGGFTDCLLQHGAAGVYALDVGRGQLHEKLQADPRVIGREKINVRYLDEKIVPRLCELAVADLSYISLTKVLKAIWSRVAEEGRVICLVKPQFEAGPGAVDKRGVIRDPAVHRRVLEELFLFCRGEGWESAGLTYSPIRGPEGNIEYLLYLKRKPAEGSLPDIAAVVKEAHSVL